jgi:hypothetical protein
LLASGSVLLAPVILGNGTRLSMNPLEPLFWMGWIYFLFLAIHRQQPKLLLWCGVLLGFGLENKHSTVFFLSALVVGLLATPGAPTAYQKVVLDRSRDRVCQRLSECCLGISASLPYARRPAPCKSDSQERRIATSAIYWPADPGARSGQRPRLDCWTRLPALPPRWKALSLPGRDISRLPWP